MTATVDIDIDLVDETRAWVDIGDHAYNVSMRAHIRTVTGDRNVLIYRHGQLLGAMAAPHYRRKR